MGITELLSQDERVAAVFWVVSGEMGGALIRRDWGETLIDMAQNFPWQFAGNFQKWVGKWNDLPVDQHMLIALCAPRPVYVNGGLTDQWSDPKGQFLADRKSTRLNSSHLGISYAVFCLKKKNT